MIGKKGREAGGGGGGGRHACGLSWVKVNAWIWPRDRALHLPTAHKKNGGQINSCANPFPKPSSAIAQLRQTLKCTKKPSRPPRELSLWVTGCRLSVVIRESLVPAPESIFAWHFTIYKMLCCICCFDTFSIPKNG